MKKVLLCASLIALSASAFASDSGLYVRGDIGASKMKLSEKVTPANKVTNDTKPVYNLGVGYNFNDNLRADLNAQLRNSEIEKNGHSLKNSEYKSKAVFLNGYYDFKNDTLFTPYVTAGVGFAKNSIEKLPADHTSKSNTNFAWNTGVGSKVNVSKNVDLDVSYRYSNLGNFKYTASNVEHKFKAKAHEVMAGVIYNF
ncbi:MAG: porin family protein [Alphaproteobacteria bacterium]|nr:porin family protein [Alphaproteobacteria bacterium]